MAARLDKPPGRKAGIPNKLSGAARENIAAVFTRLGGTAAMADWARENQTEFYKIYSKLIPLQVTGAEGGPVQVAVEVVFVEPHAPT